MIGHLQSRKPRTYCHGPAWSTRWIRSSSPAVEPCLPSRRARMSILLEVNVAGEASKYGLTPAELPDGVEAIAALPSLRVRGLMTMAPIVPDSEQARPVFAGLPVCATIWPAASRRSIGVTSRWA